MKFCRPVCFADSWEKIVVGIRIIKQDLSAYVVLIRLIILEEVDCSYDDMLWM